MNAVQTITMLTAERDAARAELAAANTRITELEAVLPKRTNDWLAHCKRLDAERDAVSDDLCKAWKDLGEVESERDALQATLDRVTALADEWEAEARHWTDQAEGMSGDRAAKNYALASKYQLHAQRVRAAIDGPGDTTQPQCDHRWRAVPPDGMAEGYWKCKRCQATHDDPLDLDNPTPRPTGPDDRSDGQ